jgi:hypothetical protein
MVVAMRHLLSIFHSKVSENRFAGETGCVMTTLLGAARFAKEWTHSTCEKMSPTRVMERLKTPRGSTLGAHRKWPVCSGCQNRHRCTEPPLIPCGKEPVS